MFTLRFTTLVEAPLTVAFDVARSLGRPWHLPLEEVVSERPVRDAYAGGSKRRRLTHARWFAATAQGTVVVEEVEVRWSRPGTAGWMLDRLLLRRRVRRAMRAHLDAYAAAAAQRALDVVQVVGAALIRGSSVLVAQRVGGPYDGCWEFPGGKVEPGESELAALARELCEELGVQVAPGAFVGEVPLDGAVGGGAPGVSTLRIWSARITAGDPVAIEHAQLRWVTAEELGALDWIAADRPLLPAVRALLDR